MKFDTNNLPIQVFPEQFSLRFYLRDKHSARHTDIIYTFRWPGRRINVNRGMKVVPEQWNPKDQRADVSYRFPEINNVANRRINRTLDDDKALFELIVWNVCTNPDEFLNFETIINEHFMSKTKRKEKSEVKVDVFKIIKDAIINNSTISEHTQDNYIKKGLKALIAFSKYREAMGEGAIDSFGMLNMDMIDAFVEYLKSGKYVRDGGAPYAMGTLNSIIKYAVSAIKCTPTSYIRKSELQLISAPQLTDKTADNNEIALQDAEVMKLWRYSPASEEDRKILDMFLLECTTGQRVSDLPKIVDGMQDRDGTLYITIVQEKNE